LNDRIFLEGIKFHGFHGLTRMERQVGCRLAVDVSADNGYSEGFVALVKNSAAVIFITP
jgi:dihydroneopterin aldolase